jgi:hypothetical protein
MNDNCLREGNIKKEIRPDIIVKGALSVSVVFDLFVKKLEKKVVNSF